jgi:hypothetical protein
MEVFTFEITSRFNNAESKSPLLTMILDQFHKPVILTAYAHNTKQLVVAITPASYLIDLWSKYISGARIIRKDFVATSAATGKY